MSNARVLYYVRTVDSDKVCIFSKWSLVMGSYVVANKVLLPNIEGEGRLKNSFNYHTQIRK